jgi:hypothetical protein
MIGRGENIGFCPKNCLYIFIVDCAVRSVPALGFKSTPNVLFKGSELSWGNCSQRSWALIEL